MTTDVEISRNFVDEHESREFTSFIILQRIRSWFISFLALGFTLVGFLEILVSSLFCINFSMTIIVDVLNNTNFVTLLIKSVLHEFSLDVNNVDSSDINNI